MIINCTKVYLQSFHSKCLQVTSKVCFIKRNITFSFSIRNKLIGWVYVVRAIIIINTRFISCRNFIGDEDCLKPALTEMKLEPADCDSGDLQAQVTTRKADKVRTYFFHLSSNGISLSSSQKDKISSFDRKS